MPNFKPFNFLDTDRVLNLAEEVLWKEGVEIESEKVRDLLAGHGAKIEKVEDRTHPVAFLPSDLVKKCVKTVPTSIRMYDRNGKEGPLLGGDLTYFNPGSCGTNYYDPVTDTHRKATEQDLTDLVRVADKLEHIHMVSTSVVANEVDPRIQDAYRLKVVLENSTKPIVTGTLSENFELMKDMLVAVRGSEEELKKKPLAIFDCCPSPALKWAKIWSEDLIRCGKYGIPAEFISMPQPGLSSPPTLFDSLVQHTAETLSGIVISQLANPGAPLIYGGSPTMVNHKSMGVTPLLGDIGTMRLDMAYIKVAKSLNLPCQCYLGLSDSKRVDVQAGFEKGMSILLTVLAGVNNVSGPGMLESENCQCKEMLIIDNEFCGSALHFAKWITRLHNSTVEDIGLMARENVVDPDRIGFLRSGEFYDAPLADKEILDLWEVGGRKSMLDNAIEKGREILREDVEALPDDVSKELDKQLQ